MSNNKLFFEIFLFLALLYLAFQTKPWTNVKGNIYSGDDNSYYGYVSSIVNDFDFDFSNNEVVGHSGTSPVTGKIILMHPIGTSILLIPFYVIAKPIVRLIHWFTNTPFNQRHPLFFMFMCSGILLYAYLGGYFLFKAISLLGIDSRISLISVILGIWGTILPVYIFKRPIFTLIPQFFLISLLVYFIIKWRNNHSVNFKQLLILATLSGGILITRWNDLHIVLFTMYFLSMQRTPLSGTFNKRILLTLFFSIIVFSIFFFTQGLAWKSFLGGFFTLPYNPTTVHGPMSKLFSSSSLINFLHIFIGLDWGILYTMLTFAVGLISFFWFNPLTISRWRNLDRIVYAILFSLPFIIHIKLGQQGSYYGYRHLLSLLPFTCLGLAVFFDRICKKFPNSLKLLNLFMIVILVFNFFLILPFEYKQSTTLELGTSVMGGEGWINNFYVRNAIKIYFTSSAKTLAGLFARGFMGGYIFGGIYLLFPETFFRIAEIDAKIHPYYALDSLEKWVVLCYPLLAVAMLTVLHLFLNKKFSN